MVTQRGVAVIAFGVALRLGVLGLALRTTSSARVGDVRALVF
jgi:hypothetical protein